MGYPMRLLDQPTAAIGFGVGGLREASKVAVGGISQRVHVTDLPMEPLRLFRSALCRRRSMTCVSCKKGCGYMPFYSGVTFPDSRRPRHTLLGVKVEREVCAYLLTDCRGP